MCNLSMETREHFSDASGILWAQFIAEISLPLLALAIKTVLELHYRFSVLPVVSGPSRLILGRLES